MCELSMNLFNNSDIFYRGLTYRIFASQGLRAALLIFTLDIARRIFEVTRQRFMCNAASGSCNQSERALQKAHVL